MTVYVEYAFLVNALLDGVLLFLALRCARARVRAWRLLLAAAVGGGEAVLFPLFSLPAWAGTAVKLLGGAMLPLIAAPRGKPCLVSLAAFFAMTFLFGGALTALCTYFELPHLEQGGYFIEGAPVTLVLCGAAVLFLAVTASVKAFYRYRARRQNLFPCRVTAGGNTYSWTGFADSGNLLAFRGAPVCVVSAAGALALFRGRRPDGRMTLTTVAGARDAPVFTADRLTVGGRVYRNVCFTVGEVRSKEYTILLHTAFTEGNHENSGSAEEMAESTRGE